MNDIPDVTQNGARLYDFFDKETGAPVPDAWRLTYREARFIYGSEQLREWEHRPHKPVGS